MVGDAWRKVRKSWSPDDFGTKLKIQEDMQIDSLGEVKTKMHRRQVGVELEPRYDAHMPWTQIGTR